MSVTTVSSSMITDATILNADIGAAAAIATTKLGAGAIVQVVNVMSSAVATGTTSATTFKIRAGGNGAGTWTFNGQSGARRYGGVEASSITITEIAV